MYLCDGLNQSGVAVVLRVRVVSMNACACVCNVNGSELTNEHLVNVIDPLSCKEKVGGVEEKGTQACQGERKIISKGFDVYAM